MPKSFNSRDILRLLTDGGWVLDRIAGSHHQFRHPTRPGTVTVKHPQRDIPTGTLRSIFRQAGWRWPPR